jgi:predicted transcriptional regulator
MVLSKSKMPAEYFTESDNKVLELNLRRKIYGIVRDYAGSHFREIERRSKIATGTAKHHLDYLKKQGLIKMEKTGNNSRYFPRGFNADNENIMGYLRQKSMRKIILEVFTNPGCIHEDIVKKVNLAPSTVSWHLKKLIDSNIIKSTKVGRKTQFKILIDKKIILNLLITYRESFFDKIVDNIIDMGETR